MRLFRRQNVKAFSSRLQTFSDGLPASTAANSPVSRTGASPCISGYQTAVEIGPLGSSIMTMVRLEAVSSLTSA
jgi:hypothetical protein